MPMYIKSDKKINNITFKIGGKIITRIPLEFCNKLYGQQTIKDDYYLYKIPDLPNSFTPLRLNNIS